MAIRFVSRRVDELTTRDTRVAGALCIWDEAIATGQAFAIVKRSISVAHFDRDAPSQLLAVGAGPDAGDGFDECGLAVVNVARSADVDARLIAIFFDVPIRQSLFPMQC